MGSLTNRLLLILLLASAAPTVADDGKIVAVNTDGLNPGEFEAIATRHDERVLVALGNSPREREGNVTATYVVGDSENGNYPLVLQLGRTVFTSGGISSRASRYHVDEINAKVTLEATRYPEVLALLASERVDLESMNFSDAYEKYVGKRRYKEASALLEEVDDMLTPHNDAPHQYRGTAACHPYTESFNTEPFLKRASADRIVVKALPGQATSLRLNGSVVALAAGDAVVISDDSITLIDGTPIPREVRSISRILSNMDDAQLERFFRQAEVIETEEIGTGITKPLRVTQRMDGITRDAVFKHVDSEPDMQNRRAYSRKLDYADRNVFEIAAYRLDRMLDLQLIPVAVARNVDGKDGVLQDWVTGAINERDRLEDDIAFESHCKQYEQYRLRFVFDILIHNDDRNLTNILWHKEDFMLWFIDHTRAFRSPPRRPKQLRNVDLRVSDQLRARLSSLNEDNLTRELGDYLHPKQIESLLKRRDLILEEALTTDLADAED